MSEQRSAAMRTMDAQVRRAEQNVAEAQRILLAHQEALSALRNARDAIESVENYERLESDRKSGKQPPPPGPPDPPIVPGPKPVA